MIATAAAASAEMGLPEVYHFMTERPEDIFITLTWERVRIQGDFVSTDIISPVSEALVPEVSVGSFASLKRDQAGRENTTKHLPIHEVERFLKCAVLAWSNTRRFHSSSIYFVAYDDNLEKNRRIVVNLN
jgi:hypothetical protein